ncbi:MAG: pyridoxal phosphate enzyme (YggS family) [Planctomycetota bacterium]
MFPSRSAEFLEERLEIARSELTDLCRASGRKPNTVQLLPVTKAVDAITTATLYSMGEREFAENRADALVAKDEKLAARGMRPRWHFIGPLQRNKARRVVRVASVLHSVHSLALIETLERIATEEDRTLDLYLQVHLSGDSNKQGFDLDQLDQAALQVTQAPHLRLLGLMTMGPLEDPDGSGTQRTFEQGFQLAQGLSNSPAIELVDGHCGLSMGMSQDLKWAVPNGSTLVRVGSALFR